MYKKEVEQRLPAIIHSKLIVIDPLDKNNRIAIHTSGNFSPEMWKNHDTFDFGCAEAWVKATNEEIIKLEQESRNLIDSDVLIAEGYKTIGVKPGDDLAELCNTIGKEIGTATKDISIIDPYLGKIDRVFEYLQVWLRKDVSIRIITAHVESKEIAKVKEKYSASGYNNIQIIRYLDSERKNERDTILHDRYIIIDRKKVIRIGKGLTAILEKTNKAKDNVIVDILEIPSEVEKFLNQFDEFWNYNSSGNIVIKSFPKQEF